MFKFPKEWAIPRCDPALMVASGHLPDHLRRFVVCACGGLFLPSPSLHLEPVLLKVVLTKVRKSESLKATCTYCEVSVPDQSSQLLPLWENSTVELVHCD